MHVVDDEVTHHHRRTAVAPLRLVPVASFIEDDIARHTHMLGRQVEDVIRLGTLSIADEDTWRASVIQLAEMVQLFYVSQAGESP